MTRFTDPDALRRSIESRLATYTREHPGVPVVRLRKSIAFEMLLRRLIDADPDYWLVKGGYSLQLRVGLETRTTRDIDLRGAGGIDDALDRFYRTVLAPTDDFFVFEAAQAQIELAGAPEGGRRVPVALRLAGRLFERFHVDIGCGDVLSGPVQHVRGSGVLEAVGLEPVALPLYPLPTSIAEKLHAYTLPRTQPNMRVRDLVDLVLMLDAFDLERDSVQRACEATFRARGSHAWPPDLAPPPDTWRGPFTRLRDETGITTRTPDDAHALIVAFVAGLLLPNSRVWRHAQQQWESPDAGSQVMAPGERTGPA